MLEADRPYVGSGKLIGKADGLRRRQIITFFYLYM
jgi:hypothetical protein